MNPEVGEIDPVALMQKELGVDESTAIDLASIQLRCPGADGTNVDTLGNFLVSKHGSEQGALEVVRKVAAEVREAGVTHDEAIIKMLGILAVFEDPNSGRLVRVSLPDSKKK